MLLQTAFKPTFDDVFSNVVDYAEAQISMSALSNYEPLRQVFTRTPPHPSFFPPVGYFKFQTLTAEDKNNLAGYGLEEDTTAKAWRGIPQIHNLPAIYKMGGDDARQIPGATSANGYLAYMYTLKAMTIFSHLSCASMYMKSSIFSPDLNEFGGPSNIGDPFVALALGASAVAGAKGFAIPAGQTHQHGLQLNRVFPMFVPVNEIDGLSVYSVSTSFVPNRHGYLFPYFTGMVLPDRDLPSQVFQRFFLRGLSAKQENVQKLWQRIKMGLRNIALLPAGMAISHIYLGMLLADQCKAQIRYIIENKNYHGFTLLGDHCRIIQNNRVIDPSPADVLGSLFPTITTAPVALVKLVNVMKVPTNPDGTQKYDMTSKGSREFYKKLRRVDWSDFDSQDDLKMKEIRGYLDHITFDEQPTEASLSNIRVFLDYVATGEETLLDPFPAFFKQETYRAVDRITIGLTIFGYSAPSMSYGTAKKAIRLQIPKEDAPEDLLLHKQLVSIPFKLVPFQAAVLQWTTMFSRQEIVLPLPDKRKSGNSWTDLSGTKHNLTGSQYDIVYGKVKNIANIHRAANEGKRKRGLDAEGSSKKAKVTGTEFEDV